MAALTQEVDSMAELTKSHLGKNSVGLTNFDNSSLPEVAQGSVLRIGSVLYYASGNLSVGNLAGAADGKVYFYAQADGTLIVSSTTPTWSDVYQCWMNVTDICYASCLKAGASYTQKTIWFNRLLGLTADGLYLGLGADADRVIRFASDASLLWDESENKYVLDKALEIGSNILSADFNYAAGSGTLIKTTAGATTDFYIKKPITAYFTTAWNTGYLKIYQEGDWRTVAKGNGAVGPSIYNLHLNPGQYRFIDTNLGTMSLYCTGVFGRSSIVASEIVT